MRKINIMYLIFSLILISYAIFFYVNRYQTNENKIENFINLKIESLEKMYKTYDDLNVDIKILKKYRNNKFDFQIDIEDDNFKEEDFLNNELDEKYYLKFILISNYTENIKIIINKKYFSIIKYNNTIDDFDIIKLNKFI
jgi:hypothetical protein